MSLSPGKLLLAITRRRPSLEQMPAKGSAASHNAFGALESNAFAGMQHLLTETRKSGFFCDTVGALPKPFPTTLYFLSVNTMSKHLQNLQRLCQKMQARYGEHDALVLELKQEIAAHEAKKSKNTAAMNPHRRKEDQSALAQRLH